MELKKLSVVKGGLKITYLTEETSGGSVYFKETSEKKTLEPHPDLGNELQKFGNFIGLLLKKEDVSDIIINGISLSGAGENERLKIDYQFNGADMTAKFYINGGMYDFEKSINDQIAAIEEEARLYLFEDKVAQLELFDDND